MLCVVLRYDLLLYMNYVVMWLIVSCCGVL